MHKKIICGVIVTVLALFMAYADNNTLPKNYKSPLYSCSLSNQDYGDGFSFIKFKDRDFGSFAGTYMRIKDEKGKVVRCREILLPNNSAGNINMSDDGAVVSFTTVRQIKSEAGKAYAEVERQYKLTPDAIEVKVQWTAKEDMELEASWLLYDLLSLRTSSLTGATVEAKTAGDNPEVVNALVPKVYSKEKWSLNSAYSDIKFMADNAGFNIAATVGSVTINHYGGSDIEISFKPITKYSAVKYAKDSILTWSFCLKFSEQQ